MKHYKEQNYYLGKTVHMKKCDLHSIIKRTEEIERLVDQTSDETSLDYIDLNDLSHELKKIDNILRFALTKARSKEIGIKLLKNDLA